MSALNAYRVTWHGEKNGRRSTETQQHNVVAADQTFNTISAVLNGNSVIPAGHTLVIESIGHCGFCGAVLS